MDYSQYYEFERLYPDNWYDAPKILIDEFGFVTQENYLDLARLATAQFKYLLDHPHKSGYYFVDWRVNFFNLNEFLYYNDIHCQDADMKTLSKFLYYFEMSADELYRRLDIDDDSSDDTDE